MTTEYYISPSVGSATASGLSAVTPKSNFSQVVPLLQPGDTVYFMEGEYKPVNSYTPIIDLDGVNGAEDKLITICPLGDAKVLLTSFPSYNVVRILNSSYIQIVGLTTKGNRENVTYEYAYANRKTPNASLTDNGIMVKNSHHIYVIGNTVTDHVGGGITFIECDYYVAAHNTVARNAWYSPYGCQGISVLTSKDVDTNTGIKAVIEYNHCYENREFIQWVNAEQHDLENPTNPWGITDGYGIIIDTEGKHAYKGTTRIKGNLCEYNGKAGIQVFFSDNPIIIEDNICRYNGLTDNKEGELSINKGANVTLSNNLLLTSNPGTALLKGTPKSAYGSPTYF